MNSGTSGQRNRLPQVCQQKAGGDYKAHGRARIHGQKRWEQNCVLHGLVKGQDDNSNFVGVNCPVKFELFSNQRIQRYWRFH